LDSKCNASAMPLKERKGKESKVKEKEIECISCLSEPIQKKVKEFMEHRKKIKSPMSEKAVELFVNRLLSLSPSENTQIEIVDTAILNGWKSVYPLKNDNECRPKGQTITERMRDL